MGGLNIMSVNYITMVNGHKVARPILTRKDFLSLRGSRQQQERLQVARSGQQPAADMAKRALVQMNYSCLPADDGVLKGCKTPSMSVGMDVDFDKSDPDYERKMAEAPKRILEKRDELGLLMLERSVNKGYHLVFRRKDTEGLADGRVLENQEMNLRRASDLLGIEFDKGAKDITRVFFTTGDTPDDLLFLDDALFEREALSEREAPL